MAADDGQARDAKPARYLVAGCTPWVRRVYDQRLSKLPGDWVYVETPLALEESVRAFAPRYAFVLHWRWRVPLVVLVATECVGFHLGAFAHYRGGTPLQHQILAGERESMLTVYQMTDEIDAGSIYTVVPVPLHGSAEAVYARGMAAAATTIESFLRVPWKPTPARLLGPTLHRRTPAESCLPGRGSLSRVYDFVRMLDAEGYPHAFLDHGNLRLTVRRAVLYDGRVECDCTITVRETDT